MSPSERRPPSLAVQLALGALLAGALVVAARVVPVSEPDAAALAGARCDVGQGPCRVGLGEGREMTVSLAPLPPPNGKPLTLAADFAGLEPRAVDVTVTGATMDMGETHAALAATAPRHFEVEAALPACTVKHMVWVARLGVQADDGYRAVALRFETGVGR